MTGLTPAADPAIAADLARWREPDLDLLVVANPAFHPLAAASAGR